MELKTSFEGMKDSGLCTIMSGQLPQVFSGSMKLFPVDIGLWGHWNPACPHNHPGKVF